MLKYFILGMALGMGVIVLFFSTYNIGRFEGIKEGSAVCAGSGK